MTKKTVLVVKKHDSDGTSPIEMSKEQKSLVKRVYLLAYDVLRSLLPSAERFALIEETEDGFRFLVSNELGEAVETQIPPRMLKVAFQESGVLCLPDAVQDQRHGSLEVVKKKSIRSVLCVEFVSPGDRKALLYADSLNRPALFTTKDQREVEALAERLTRNLQIISMADPQTVQLPSDQEVKPDGTLRNGLLACLAVLLLLSGGAVASQSWGLEPVISQQNSDGPPDLASRPFGVTRDFMLLLKSDRVAEAQSHLDLTLRGRAGQGDLAALAKELQEQEAAQTPLKVLSEEVHAGKATVVVGQTLLGAPTNLWTLHFELVGGSWKITEAEGQSFPERVWKEAS